MTTEYDRRKGLSFRQAEGIDELPQQMRSDELPLSTRNALWALIYASAKDKSGYEVANQEWKTLLTVMYVSFFNMPLDEFSVSDALDKVKSTLFDGAYYDCYELIQWIARYEPAPHRTVDSFQTVLEKSRAGFRFVNRDTLVPMTSEQERRTLEAAFEDLSGAKMTGALSHLRTSASHLTHGRYADSVRESIHVVESVARAIVGNETSLDRALMNLEKRKSIHPAMKRGFGALYGYTNDHQGIRHPLVDDPVANVDEADALFMIGACAAFASYLIQKSIS
jgi:hypothetical protein